MTSVLSKLYNDRVSSGQIYLIFSKEKKERIMDDIKEHYKIIGEELPFDPDKYEVFMLDENSDPLLENQTDGSVITIAMKRSYTKYDLRLSGYKSIEAAVFAQLVQFASEYIGALGYCDYDEFREDYKEGIEAFEKYFPDEWVRELWRIHEDSFETIHHMPSLLDWQDVIPILKKHGIC